MSRVKAVAQRGLTSLVVFAVGVTPVLAGGTADRAEGVAPPKRLPAPVTEPVTPPPTADTLPIAALPKALRRAIVADAAKRLKVAESAVVLTRAERVTWSDGALGCPKPGLMYTQALVPGYRVVARSAAAEIQYHTDERGQVVTCDSLPRPNPGAAPAPRPGTETLRPVKSAPDR